LHQHEEPQEVGRPRKGEEKHRPVHLGVKVSEQLNADLRQLAEKRGSPISDVVVGIPERGAAGRGQDGEPARQVSGLAMTVQI
jgi:hypothetical protein